MNLKQFSSHLGLSPTTVSRALNGYPEVSEKTRNRVLDAARVLNYSPNARARGLATGRAQAVGLVLPTSAREQIVNPVFGDFIAGVGEICATASYDLVLSLVEDAGEDEHYRTLRARGSVDGVIVSAPRTDDHRIGLLAELGLPFVVLGRASLVQERYSWLDTNNVSGFWRATDLLLDLGHRRVALINGPEAMDFAHRRRAGFETALQARGIAPDPVLMTSAEMTEVYGYTAARAMLDFDDPPTAFLVGSIILAIGVRRAIQEAGLRMGHDVSVVTHDDDLSSLNNGQEVPIFTATRSSVRIAGKRLAEMLLTLIDTPDRAPMSHLMEAELVMGTSTGPAPRHGLP